MAKNTFSKYSKTGGLNPLWVEKDIQICEEKKQKDYIDYICNAASKSVVNTLNGISNNDTNNYNNTRNHNKIKNSVSLNNELEIKFQFLKRHSDGTETDYEIAKHILGLK